MTNAKFLCLVNTVTLYGHKVLVEDDYSDDLLKELVSALKVLLDEVSWK